MQALFGSEDARRTGVKVACEASSDGKMDAWLWCFIRQCVPSSGLLGRPE